jgi:hypothetical protein
MQYDMRLTVTLPADHLGGIPESLKSLHFVQKTLPFDTVVFELKRGSRSPRLPP